MSLHVFVWLVLALGWGSTCNHVVLEPAVFTVDNR